MGAKDGRWGPERTLFIGFYQGSTEKHSMPDAAPSTGDKDGSLYPREDSLPSNAHESSAKRSDACCPRDRFAGGSGKPSQSSPCVKKMGTVTLCKQRVEALIQNKALERGHANLGRARHYLRR